MQIPKQSSKTLFSSWRLAMVMSLFIVHVESRAMASAPKDPAYASLGFGYGRILGDKLITRQQSGSPDLPVASTDADCCPSDGLSMDLRLGYQLAHTVAPELTLMGHGWSFSSPWVGGALFIGGGARFYPMAFFDDASQSGALQFSVATTAGYAMVGADFGYAGLYLGFDAAVEMRVLSFLSLGFRVGTAIPFFKNFVYTDFGSDIGRCLDSERDQVIPGFHGVQRESDAQCSGRGPGAFYLAPQITATIYFDLFTGATS
jgi:hypothetical protein